MAAAAATAQAPLLPPGQALNQIIQLTAMPKQAPAPPRDLRGTKPPAAPSPPPQSCPNADQLRQSLNADGEFLSQRLGQAGWDKVGKNYVASLNDLASGLAKIGTSPAGQNACALLTLIAGDLHAKRQDCEALGHSRTDIPVEITTTMGQQPKPGLEVYTRWLPAGDHFTTVPKRLEALSTPARGTVPIPGEFEIFAKDPSTGQSSDPERVSIGGTQVFRWPLPVRFSNSPAGK